MTTVQTVEKAVKSGKVASVANLAEVAPVGKTKKAGTKEGAAGYALATVLIKAAIDKAEREEKERESMKDTLKRLEKFSREDHLQFRANLEYERNTIRETAESLGFSLTAYKAMDSKSASVDVTVSLWLKMSKAIETHYKPDYSQSWGYISQSATEFNEARAVEKLQAAQAEAKAAGIAPPVEHVAPTKRKGRTAQPAHEKAIKMLSDFPNQELELVYNWLRSRLNKKA